jgi:hypothetical protein
VRRCYSRGGVARISRSSIWYSTQEYATMTARDWNVPTSGCGVSLGSRCGRLSSTGTRYTRWRVEPRGRSCRSRRRHVLAGLAHVVAGKRSGARFWFWLSRAEIAGHPSAGIAARDRDCCRAASGLAINQCAAPEHGFTGIRGGAGGRSPRRCRSGPQGRRTAGRVLGRSASRSRWRPSSWRRCRRDRQPALGTRGPGAG